MTGELILAIVVPSVLIVGSVVGSVSLAMNAWADEPETAPYRLLNWALRAHFRRQERQAAQRDAILASDRRRRRVEDVRRTSATYAEAVRILDGQHDDRGALSITEIAPVGALSEGAIND